MTYQNVDLAARERRTTTWSRAVFVVTMDADFIGTSNTAQELQRSLGSPWKLRKSTLDDFGGRRSMRLYRRRALSKSTSFPGIVGLDTDVIRKRASQLTLVDGKMIQLLHPLDVLESRLRNLDSLPSKRNAIGVAQARLAVSVVRAFIGQFMDASGDPRTVRQAIKRVEKLALDTRLFTVAFTYELDVLAAVPVERVAYPRFHERQWPKTLERLERKRERFIASQARRVALNAKRKSRVLAPFGTDAHPG